MDSLQPLKALFITNVFDAEIWAKDDFKFQVYNYLDLKPDWLTF